jgi:hypothetical protein
MFIVESNGIYKEQTTSNGSKEYYFHDQEYHTKLTTDKTSILADGVDTATITATVYNYLDEQQSTWTGDIVFELDGVTQKAATTNGVASITFNTTVNGKYIFKTVVGVIRNGEVVINA